MSLQVYLDQAIKAVCPIHGVSFGKLDDKSTWRINFANEATDKQKAEAQKIIDDFVWDDNKKEKYRKIERDEKYKDDLLMRKAFKEYQDTFPQTSFSDFLDYLESIS